MMELKKLPAKKKTEKKSKCKAMQGQKGLPWGEKSTAEEVAQAQGRHDPCLTTPNVLPSTPNVTVLRVGDTWLAGVWKLPPPMGSDVFISLPSWLAG